jgi:hypothetical protein
MSEIKDNNNSNRKEGDGLSNELNEKIPNSKEKLTNNLLFFEKSNTDSPASKN